MTKARTRKLMTKAEMLAAMTSAGNVKCYIRQNHVIRTVYVREGWRRFNEVSHTAGRKYIEESRRVAERCYGAGGNAKLQGFVPVVPACCYR